MPSPLPLCEQDQEGWDCLNEEKDDDEVQLEPTRARPTAAEEAAAGKGDKHGDTETAVEEDLTMHDAVRLTLAPYHRSHTALVPGIGPLGEGWVEGGASTHCSRSFTTVLRRAQ